jgi:hypothetical protein
MNHDANAAEHLHMVCENRTARTRRAVRSQNRPLLGNDRLREASPAAHHRDDGGLGSLTLASLLTATEALVHGGPTFRDALPRACDTEQELAAIGRVGAGRCKQAEDADLLSANATLMPAIR